MSTEEKAKSASWYPAEDETYFHAFFRLIPLGYNTTYKLLEQLEKDWCKGKRSRPVIKSSLQSQMESAVCKGLINVVGTELYQKYWYNVYELNPNPPDNRTKKQVILDTLKDAVAPMTSKEIVVFTGFDIHTVKPAIQALMKANLVAAVGRAGREAYYEFNPELAAKRPTPAQRAARRAQLEGKPRTPKKPKKPKKPEAVFPKKPDNPDIIDLSFDLIRRRHAK